MARRHPGGLNSQAWFIEAVGAEADPSWFPDDGLVHLDLHTDNILAAEDGTLARGEDLARYCERHRLPALSVADVVVYRTHVDTSREEASLLTSGIASSTVPA